MLLKDGDIFRWLTIEWFLAEVKEHNSHISSIVFIYNSSWAEHTETIEKLKWLTWEELNHYLLTWILTSRETLTTNIDKVFCCKPRSRCWGGKKRKATVKACSSSCNIIQKQRALTWIHRDTGGKTCTTRVASASWTNTHLLSHSSHEELLSGCLSSQ